MAYPIESPHSLVEGVLLKVIEQTLHIFVQLLAEVRTPRSYNKILVVGRC